MNNQTQIYIEASFKQLKNSLKLLQGLYFDFQLSVYRFIIALAELLYVTIKSKQKGKYFLQNLEKRLWKNAKVIAKPKNVVFIILFTAVVVVVIVSQACL